MVSSVVSTQSEEWKLPEESACALLKKAKVDSQGAQFIQIAGGRNNRVFRVEVGGKLFLLKAYFSEPSDPRDRLRQEFEFVTYAWGNGIRSVSQPFGADKENHLALYEFIQGRKLKLEEIDRHHVKQAIRFYGDTNQYKDSKEAQALLPASEACFSIPDHILTTERRVRRLENMDETLDVDLEARKFVREKLIPLWGDLKIFLQNETAKNPVSIRTLEPQERCLSPSDFGYHNAICEPDGRLRFLDFEYAGWDDPAKLICDFANQPDMLLSEELSSLFQKAVIEADAFPDRLEERVRWLMPLYQIKWTCITLNDFLPFGRSRRKFTEETDESAKKIFQLNKAQTMFSRAQSAMKNFG